MAPSVEAFDMAGVVTGSAANAAELAERASAVARSTRFKRSKAVDGQSGLRIIQTGDRIDLLITDVGLPNGLNGRQVADAARGINSKLKVLFITGFAENAAIGNGHFEAGMSVITKPFVNAALVNKVRQIIDG
jgi:DNA-binding response OmpR family regulator